MRALGAILMGLGVALGGALAIAIAAAQWIPVLAAIPWLVAVGLAKLTFVGALGLIGAGAVARRLAIRSAARLSLDGEPASELGPG